MSLRQRAKSAASVAITPSRLPRAKAQAARLISRTRVTTRLYYLLRGGYDREQRTMLSGIAAYHDGEAGRESLPRFRMRRDTHRLEKGLSASPRRSVFALDYVGELVDALARVVTDGDPDLDAGLITWTHDVLTEYFRVVEDPRVESHRCTFEEIRYATEPAAAPSRPTVLLEGPSPVAYGDLLALAERRKSVRRFLDKPVTRRDIDRAVAVAAQSPSACNRQAFRFRVFDDPAQALAMTDLAPGYVLSDSAVPTMIAVVGRFRAYYRERDQHVVYIDGALASMALVLALETLGLSTCCINWPSVPRHDRRAQVELGLADDERILMFIAVGHADPEALVPHSEKTPIDELRAFGSADEDEEDRS